MTESEYNNIISAVLSAIRTNSKKIEQLTPVVNLDEGDCFEVSGGRRISYSNLRAITIEYIQDKLQDYENLDSDIALLQSKVPTVDISQIDTLTGACIVGSIVTVNSVGKSAGHILCSSCSDLNSLQQVFITYLPLNANKQISINHTDNGEMHIYTRIYCLRADSITVAGTGEVVTKNHWSAWSEISGAGIKELNEEVTELKAQLVMGVEIEDDTGVVSLLYDDDNSTFADATINPMTGEIEIYQNLTI